VKHAEKRKRSRPAYTERKP